LCPNFQNIGKLIGKYLQKYCELARVSNFLCRENHYQENPGKSCTANIFAAKNTTFACVLIFKNHQTNWKIFTNIR
jgi:hypothetical protein